jgi:hypothetical protein
MAHAKVISILLSDTKLHSSAIIVMVCGGGSFWDSKLSGFLALFWFACPVHHQMQKIATKIMQFGRDLSSE